LRDPLVYALGLMADGFQLAFQGGQLWLPQIVQALSFSNTTVGFLVAIP
jgi:hypothetical protein